MAFDSRKSAWILLSLGVILALTPPAIAHVCWVYAGLPAVNPQPWHIANPETGCVGSNGDHPAGSTTGQVIGEEHRNWHCINNEAMTEAYGRAFLAFHRQFIGDFDAFRLSSGYDRLEIWDPFQNAPVPGNDETTTTPFSHCSIPADVRPIGAICTGCQNLPASFVGNNLNSFDSLGEVGFNLEFLWHGSYHNGVRVLGCEDIGGFLHTPRDPAFWMAHKKLDEVSRDWQSLQATDVVLVLDRSGSMDDNCPGGNANPGETPCALNDARAAAIMFADAVLDVRLDGASPAAEQHRIGLVSFSSGATTEMALTSPVGIVTDNGMNETTFETQLAGLTAVGNTSVAAGIREAISILNGVSIPNPHQVIVVLTDGKENTSPCLGGNSPSNCTPVGAMGDLTAAELGDIQVVSIGFGEGAEEANLRDVSERHGGIFIAESNLSATLNLQKFFVTALGDVFDAAVSLDPFGVLEPGQLASEPIPLNVCKDDRLSVVLGRDELGQQGRQCDMELELFTPSGAPVDRTAPGVEAGHGPRHDFLHVELPFRGESSGVWRARVVRPGGSSGDCRRQRYFISSLTKGLGRVDPFVVRPNVIVGQRLLATFRISESNRPSGGFDAVKAEATLTRPNGETETFPLFDDGTNGDSLADNHIWSYEVPKPAGEPGAYHFRAHFEIDEGGCGKVREAEYSVVVERERETCTQIIPGGPVNKYTRRGVQPGDVRVADDMFCIVNRCAVRDQYQIEIRDERGWLKTASSLGAEPFQLPPSFITRTLPAFEEACFGSPGGPGGGPLIVTAVPSEARPGDTSVASIAVRSLNRPNQGPIEARINVEVSPPRDCNANGVDDDEDIRRGTSTDRNGDGVPDECRIGPQFPGIEPPVAVVSAASFTAHAPVAPESIVSAFGANLADETAVAMSLPLPTELGGANVSVLDGSGAAHPAPLFFASPGQINYLLPVETPLGAASAAVSRGADSTQHSHLRVARVAPGLFSANADGRGVAAAIVDRLSAGGVRATDFAFEGPEGARTPKPIDLSTPGDQVYLVLFGTGLRAAAPATVRVHISGVEVPVTFAGAQGELVGLDQINVGPLPAALSGKGEADVILTAEGVAANPVTVAFR